MYLIVGLGNPGKEYEDTRHNVGFKAIDILSERNNISLNKIKFTSVYGEGRIGGQKVILLKPQTYMNNSGLAVKEAASFYKIKNENIIIIFDDIDIDFMSVRIKAKGSPGSHNGMKSLVNQLGTKDFPRVKIGIGKKRPGENLASFVLARFPKEERDLMDQVIDLASQGAEAIVRDGIDQAMNEYNNKKVLAQD